MPSITTSQSAFPALFNRAFRSFFLFGAMFSCVAMALWLWVLYEELPLKFSSNPFFWHGHEMVFGFASAIVAGFLLTAVQNWTGIPSVQGKQLALLFAVWLLPRFLLILLPASWWVSIIDLAFTPLVAYFLCRPVIIKKQWHNLVFLPVLIALTLLNLATHYSNIEGNSALLTQLLEAAVMMIVMMVLIVGGRVIPFFTENALQQKRRPNIKGLAPGLAVLIIGYLIASFSGASAMIQAGLCLFAAFAALVIVSNWFRSATLSNPLLWSLHFSSWFIPLGFMLIAMEKSTLLAVPLHSGLHALTVGTIGGMTLSMMSRVSLGHTGRKMAVHPQVAYGFALMAIAGLFRSISPLFIQQAEVNYLLPGLLWIAAFSLFLRHYLVPLATPRADGRPG